jgi:hypothetical protein
MFIIIVVGAGRNRIAVMEGYWTSTVMLEADTITCSAKIEVTNTMSDVTMVMIPMGSDGEPRPDLLLRRKSYSLKEMLGSKWDVAYHR